MSKKADAKPAKAAAGKTAVAKAGKGPKRRSGLADFMTLVIAVACTVWAFKAIVAI